MSLILTLASSYSPNWLRTFVLKLNSLLRRPTASQTSNTFATWSMFFIARARVPSRKRWRHSWKQKMNQGEIHALHYATRRPVCVRWHDGRIISIEETTQSLTPEKWITPALFDVQ